jgi:hypothetical protein
VLEDGLDELLAGFNISYIHLPDYYYETVTALKEPWLDVFEHVRNGTIGNQGWYRFVLNTF